MSYYLDSFYYLEMVLRAIKQKDMITEEYLMCLHDIDKKEAKEYLKFLKANTICHKECYGDGSKMYPKWQRAKGMVEKGKYYLAGEIVRLEKKVDEMQKFQSKMINEGVTNDQDWHNFNSRLNTLENKKWWRW